MSLLGLYVLCTIITIFALLIVQSNQFFFQMIFNFFFMQVSWLKRHGDTPHLLTFGLTTYSSDARFQIFHEQPNDWKLQIQFPNLDDSGVYECLVSTNPPLVRRTRLTVIGKLITNQDKKICRTFDYVLWMGN